MASQITSPTSVYSNVYSRADQRIHQSSARLAFVREIHRWPVNSTHKGPVTPEWFHLMTSSCKTWHGQQLVNWHKPCPRPATFLLVSSMVILSFRSYVFWVSLYIPQTILLQEASTFTHMRHKVKRPICFLTYRSYWMFDCLVTCNFWALSKQFFRKTDIPQYQPISIPFQPFHYVNIIVTSVYRYLCDVTHCVAYYQMGPLKWVVKTVISLLSKRGLYLFGCYSSILT